MILLLLWELRLLLEFLPLLTFWVLLLLLLLRFEGLLWLLSLQVGLNGVDNGAIRFTHVRVPRENLLNRFATVDKSGRYSSPLTSEVSHFRPYAVNEQGAKSYQHLPLYEIDHCTAFRPCSPRHMTPTNLLVCVERNRY